MSDRNCPIVAEDDPESNRQTASSKEIIQHGQLYSPPCGERSRLNMFTSSVGVAEDADRRGELGAVRE